MPDIINRRGVMTGAAGIFTLAATRSVHAQTASDQSAAKLPPPPTPEQWAKAPALYNVCLSPEGTHIAYIHEDKGDKLMTVFTVADGKAQAFNLGTAEVAGLLFIDNDHIVVTTQAFDRGGNGRARFNMASIYNLRTKSVTPLFQTLEGFSGALTSSAIRIVRDGKPQIVASAYKAGVRFNWFYRFDLNGGGVIVDQSPIESRHFVIGPDGGMIARDIYYERSRVYNLDYYQNGAWRTILSGKYETDLPSLICLAADGRSVVINRKDSDGERRYYQMAPDGTLSAPFPYTSNQAKVLADPFSKRMIGYQLRGDWPAYVYDDPAMAEIAAKSEKAVPGYRMSIAGRAEDPQKVIVYSEGDDDAGTYYFIDFATGANVTIGNAYPDINPAWLSDKKAITYKAGDGLDVPAFLTLPPNGTGKNLPLIVMAHDGPNYRVDLALDTEVETYAAMGYAVLQPNYRGSLGYGAKFRDAGYGQYGRKMVTDLSDGVAYLAAQGVIDPKRVCIIGKGYDATVRPGNIAPGAVDPERIIIAGTGFGGSMALNAMAFQPGTYACAIEFEGASDVHTYMDSLRGFDTSDTTHYYREQARYIGDLSKMDEISPIHAADKVKGPILIVHNETTGDSIQSRNMASALRGAGKDVTLVVKDWNFSEAQRIATANTLAAFLRKNLPV